MTLAEDQELLAVVERRFAELAESIDEARKETRERFDRTDQRFDRTDQRFDGLEAEVRHAHVRIESLEGVVQQVAEGVANVDEKLERFQAEVRGEFKEVRALIGQSYADLEQRVTALERR
jgi:chromosome segregation ATPase